jgi:hypothetical protein
MNTNDDRSWRLPGALALMANWSWLPDRVAVPLVPVTLIVARSIRPEAPNWPE